MNKVGLALMGFGTGWLIGEAFKPIPSLKQAIFGTILAFVGCIIVSIHK